MIQKSEARNQHPDTVLLSSQRRCRSLPIRDGL